MQWIQHTVNRAGFFVFVVIVLNTHIVRAQITVNCTYESMGYYYALPQTASNRVSASARFRELNGNWRTAMNPSIVLIKNQQRWVAGSIVQLNAGAAYEIELAVTDSAVSNTPVLFTTTATTKSNSPFTGTPDTLWVAPNGNGSAYTQVQPGKLENLFTTNNVTGTHRSKINTATTIMCREGTYYTGGMVYQLDNSNKYTNNNGIVVPGLIRDKPIKIVGEPGKQVVFDGSDTTVKNITWQLYDAANKIYIATLPAATAFSTELLADSVRLYPYPSTYPVGNWQECLNNLRSGDGFYRNGNNYLVKTADGKNPGEKKLTVSRQNNLFTILNTTSAPYVNQPFLFQNIRVQHYSKPIIPPAVWECVFIVICDWVVHYENTVNPEAIKCVNVQDIVFDNCRFESNSYSISINGNASNTLIQHCRFADNTGSYSHGDYKNTANYNNIPGGTNGLLNDIGKHGRHLELSPVFFSYDDYRSNRVSNKNIVFRNNVVDGFVDGLSGRQLDTLYYYDVDVYNNTFRNNYQGVSAIGNSINYRLWNNKIQNCLVGIAFYDSPVGPFYFFRNEISNLRERQNLTGSVQYQTYVNGFPPLIQQKTWGTMFKANATATANRQLEVNFFHNTVVAKDSAAFCLYLWETNWKKIRTANNNFYARFTSHRFDNINVNAEYNYTGIWDNYFSERNQVGEMIKTHGTSNTSEYKLTGNLSEATQYMRLFSKNTDTASLFLNGMVTNPLFLDDTLYNYTLTGGSPLIDTGIVIPNISDLPGVNYTGNRPDMGAYEYDPMLVYTFTGNGNWDVAANWLNNRMPPPVIKQNEQIIINPVAGGECILNVVQQVRNGAQVKVMANKKFTVLGNINIVR